MKANADSVRYFRLLWNDFSRTTVFTGGTFRAFDEYLFEYSFV